MPVSATANSIQPAPVETHALHLQRYFASLGELAGIAQQVEQRSGAAAWGRRSAMPRSLGQSTDRRLLFCSASWRAVPTTSSISGARLTGFRSELELAGFDLGEVEHLIDQAQADVCRRDARAAAARQPFPCRTAPRWSPAFRSAR